MKKKKDTSKKTLVKLSHKLYADKDTYEKVHRHLRDINDTITEEDIEKAATDVIVAKIPEATKLDQALDSETDTELTTDQEKDMYDEGEKIKSSWNILDE